MKLGWSRRRLGAKEQPVAALARTAGCFREILQANNTALGLIAEIQEALASTAPLPHDEVRRLVTDVTVQTYRMVANLGKLTPRGQRVLRSRFAKIQARLAATVSPTPALRQIGPAVPLAEAGASLAEVIGQKSAYLGEARQTLGGRVPPGVATSVTAYRAYLAHDDLGGRIAAILAAERLDDVARCFAACARIQQLMLAAPIPTRVQDAITAAVATIPGGPDLRLAVRSSAVGEGGRELSFAGQHRSFLNVSRDGVVDAVRGVFASTFTPEAVTYRLQRGLLQQEVAMCCCIITMVDARAAGVLYSATQTETGTQTLLQAVHGLGIAAVDGSVEPATYTIDPRRRAVVHRTTGLQEAVTCLGAQEGTQRRPRRRDEVGPVISDREALAVAELAWQLETALGTPVDLEWAIDRAGQVWVLQVRPQPPRLAPPAPTPRLTLPDHPVLLEAGTRVSRGIGWGRVHRVTRDLDLLQCPPGAVVVLREANPRYAVLLPRAAAVVADLGETTGHLATVARELGIPALFATRHAMERLAPHGSVTVDANAGVVYAGRVAVLVEQPPAPSPRLDPARELLAAASELIVPLTITDRLASGFAPGRCQTLHDLVRYCHQATIEVMFDAGDRAVRRGVPVRRLRSSVPIPCFLIDLGGGLADGVAADATEVELDDVVSAPLRAVWEGLTDPRLGQGQRRAVPARGFLSSMMSFGFDEDARVRQLGEPSYVFITADYVNLNSRVGYHFATLDARVGPTPLESHLSFRFGGGSTGVDQRSRRAMLIARILETHGFEIDRQWDLVNARLRQRPREELLAKLRLVGLLLEYVNHLDMALVSDRILDDYTTAFLGGDYAYGRES